MVDSFNCQPTSTSQTAASRSARSSCLACACWLTVKTVNQQAQAKQLLRAERDSFALDEEDIGCIHELQMDITLKNNHPFQKNCISIPQPLYSEVKGYIED